MEGAVDGRILVVRGGAIGDFILTLPVLQALRGNFPRASLHALVHPRVTGLARLSGTVDGTRHLESGALAGFFVEGERPDPEWADYFGGFGIVLSYLHDPDGVFRRNVIRCQEERSGRSRFLQGPHRPEESDDRHATEVLFEPLERLDVSGAPPPPRIATGRTPSGPPCLALHPGSGSPRKNWPETRWRKLVEELLEHPSLSLLLIGGEAEGDRVEGLAPRNSRCRTALRLPLEELAGELAGCRGFVGHDSGITHLAAAAGLHGLALWGGSRRSLWHPRSSRFTVVDHPQGLDRLEVAEVARRALALLDQDPGMP